MGSSPHRGRESPDDAGPERRRRARTRICRCPHIKAAIKQNKCALRGIDIDFLIVDASVYLGRRAPGGERMNKMGRSLAWPARQDNPAVLRAAGLPIPAKPDLES